MQTSRLETEMCTTPADGTHRWCAHQQVAGDEELLHEGAVAAGQRRVVEADACRQQRLQGLVVHPACRTLQSQHAGFSVKESWKASHARRQQRLQDLSSIRPVVSCLLTLHALLGGRVRIAQT